MTGKDYCIWGADPATLVIDGPKQDFFAADKPR